MSTLPFSRPFYFIRHGQTTWNAIERIQGWTETPLSELGIQQAESGRTFFKEIKIDHVVASPLERAYKTAQIITEGHGLEIETDIRLRERSYGDLEGKMRRDIVAEVGEDIYAEMRDTTAEPWDVFRARVYEGIQQALDTAHENVLIVAHGGLYRLFTQDLFGQQQNSDNAVPYLIRPDGIDTLRPEDVGRQDLKHAL